MNKYDRTTYSQRDTERKPRIVEFVSEETGESFKVHRHIQWPDTWLVSANGLCGKVDLKTDDFEEAVVKAAKLIRKLAKQRVNGLISLIEDIEKSFDIS